MIQVGAMQIQRLTHMGICVSDLERSLRFYRDLLGCKEVGRLALEGQPTATLNGWPDVKVRAVYLERDGWRLELMEFAVPGPIGPNGPRPMNQLGLTHLSFLVSDLDGVLAKLRALGATVLDATRLDGRGKGPSAIFVTDPDGSRIELVEGDFDPGRLSPSADSRR